MHKNLIKWLSEIIKKKEKGIAKKGGDAALIIQKFKVMLEKECCLHGIKTKITYYIYYIPIPN